MILHIIGLIVVGLVVGALGRLFHPGRDAMAPVMTGIIGVALGPDRGAADRRLARFRRRRRDRRRARVALVALRRAAPADAVVAPPGVRLNLEAKGVVMGDRTQRIKGKANEVAGKAKSDAGYEAGKPGTEAKGAAQTVKGKAQQAAGKARSKAKKATR